MCVKNGVVSGAGTCLFTSVCFIVLCTLSPLACSGVRGRMG